MTPIGALQPDNEFEPIDEFRAYFAIEGLTRNFGMLGWPGGTNTIRLRPCYGSSQGICELIHKTLMINGHV
jgi:hypothetical protein